MNWIRWIEAPFYHVLLCFLFRGRWWLKILLIVFSMLYAWYRQGRGREEENERVLLSNLEGLLDLLRAGNSPAYSYEKMGRFDYPDFFLHPESEHFAIQVFERQLELLEKKVLLKEELAADFAIVRVRMQLMKYLPLLMMLLIRNVFLPQSLAIAEITVVAGLTLSYYYAESLQDKS